MNDRLPPVAKWMMMTQKGVLDKFQGIPGSFSDGEGQKRFVYIEGTRKDKVLLIAHADTVWFGIKPSMGFHDGILFSKLRDQEIKYKNRYGYEVSRKGIGIGADDRAGCAMVWALRELGHSILITSGEEEGCVATKWIMSNKDWENNLNIHQFAIEFDRRGKNDCVFYDVGTTKFVEHVKENTGFIPQDGTTTDIRHICTTMCGVNLSVGYYNEHMAEEKLVLDQWLNTLSIAKTWLSQSSLPRFEQSYQDKFSIPYKYSYNQGYCSWDSEEAWNKAYGYEPAGTNTKSTDILELPVKRQDKIISLFSENKIRCFLPECDNVMLQDEWYANDFRCTKCKHLI